MIKPASLLLLATLQPALSLSARAGLQHSAFPLPRSSHLPRLFSASLISASSASAMSSNPSQPPLEHGSSEDKSSSTPLPLPAPPTDEETRQILDLSNPAGSTVKLDALGPLVVNVDGTLSRISNWQGMTELERRNTLRVLGKRNKQRLEALKAKEVEGKKDEL